MEYRITWVIELHATSPFDAARQALAIQRDPESLATVFEVSDHEHRIDLSADDCPVCVVWADDCPTCMGVCS